MKVILAQTRDIELIKQIDHLVIKEKNRIGFIERSVSEKRTYIALVNKEMIGYGVLKKNFFGYSFIEMVYISKSFRGEGYGPILMEELEKSIKSEKIFTSTNQSNKHMQHVLEKSGWIKSGIIENLDDGDPELIFCKIRKRL